MALDRDETKNTLFGKLKEQATPEVPKSATQGVEKFLGPKVRKSRSLEVPKWKTLEKVTALLTSKQRDALIELEKNIMRFRSKSTTVPADRERITVNTVLRSVLDNVIERLPGLEMSTINNEEELKIWLRQLFR